MDAANLVDTEISNSGSRFKTILASLFRFLLSLRYDIEVIGFERISAAPGRGTLFLPNHPALIDPLILMSILHRKFTPRSLSDEEQVSKPIVRQVVRLINPIIIPDIGKQGRSSRKRVVWALREVVKSLNRNQDILMYPAGRLYRGCRETIGANSGVEYIVTHAPKTRIILIRTTGLWGSSFSHAGDPEPSIHANIGRIIGYVFANLIFFGPRRKVTVEFSEDHVLKTLADRLAINAHLERFYNERVMPNTRVPYYWWQGSAPAILEEPQEGCSLGKSGQVPAVTRRLVAQKIEEIVDGEVQINHRLANDLGMDSLNMLEMAEWLEREFGVSISEALALQTVEEVILAAGGQLINPSDGSSLAAVASGSSK